MIRDTDTHDIFTGKNRPGRPRQHISNAAKQRAYRERVKNNNVTRVTKLETKNLALPIAVHGRLDALLSMYRRQQCEFDDAAIAETEREISLVLLDNF